MSFVSNFLNGSGARMIQPIPGGKYYIVEYIKDMSVSPSDAQTAYFANAMNFRKRQLAVLMDNDELITQAGSIQWFTGPLTVKTDVKNPGDLIGKLVGATVTKETAIKPKYSGSGLIVLEPTYKYLLVENLKNWLGGLVLEDGLFLACDGSVKIKTVARTTISSAVLGKEGLFNSCLTGEGRVALESPVPMEELICLDLNDEVVKIDGSFAIAWSNSLKFTVERTTKTLIGSAASGEGFVNVYRGTGRLLMAPVMSPANP